MTHRDTSKDKISLLLWAVRNCPGFWRVLFKWKRLARFVERRLVTKLVGVTDNRPHPWSTVSDYTSWRSLTDRTFFARHLPVPEKALKLPPVDAITQLFDRRKRPRMEDRLCPKSTMLFPAFAQYLTDSFLRTVPNHSANTTSTHQIDLSALYGRTEDQTDALRRKDNNVGRRGRLKSQIRKGEEYPEFLFDEGGTKVKDEFKPLDLPLNPQKTDLKDRMIFAVGGDRANSTPQIAMINTLFLREHNRIAGLIDDEKGDDKDWDDERIFQTTRNILIPIFINIAIEDYINHISTIAFPLRADSSMAWHADWNRPNWMAIEFSLLYRWHSLVPDEIDWPGRDKPVPAADMTLDNRYLIDVDLAAALECSGNQRACAIGLFNTTQSLLPVEKATIQMGKDRNLRGYNEYRKAFDLEPVERFEQITGNPNRVAALTSLYGTPDNLDFYTGLFAEDLLPNSPVPLLIGRILAVDAFSQALTNPLLSEHVFKETTFTKLGFDLIKTTHSLRDIAERNVVGNFGDVKMTWKGWRRSYFQLGYFRKWLDQLRAALRPQPKTKSSPATA